MIQNNVLGDRLNKHKAQKESEENKNFSQFTTPLIESLNIIFSTSILLLKIFVFGLTTKLVFATDWNFWEYLCVGLTMNFLLTYIHDLFRQTK